MDKKGKAIPLNGAGLLSLDSIEPPAKPLRLRVVVATDVDNPLYGRNGAAYQFGPQKGATPALVKDLDRGLRLLAEVVKRDLELDFAEAPGAGAAGGCGFGLMAFFGARRMVGFEVLRRHLGLDALIRAHDLVITGEGAFDITSLAGKGPFRLAALSRRLKRPVWGLFGKIAGSSRRMPFDRVGALLDISPTELQSLSKAEHARRLALGARSLVE